MEDKVTKMSKATISRLPIYLKALTAFQHAGKDVFLSSELAEITGILDTTIRRDFSYLNDKTTLGKRGKGYDLENLIDVLKEVLGGKKSESMILIGVGNIGNAILKYNRWQDTVGEIVCAYDLDMNKAGEAYGVKIHHLFELENTFPKDCRIAILTIDQDIQNTVNRLMDLGVIGFVDFTHEHFLVREDVSVQNVDLVAAIQELLLKVNINEVK